MTKQRILVVEDEDDIRELLRYNLQKEGYQLTCVVSGEAAIDKACSDVPDLILLDLMLPGQDGFEVCKELKKTPATQKIPIIMLTAKGEESDVVTGLELGAADYVTKPFSPRILIARVRAVLRRRAVRPAAESDVLRVHNMVIHPGRHEVLLDGQAVPFTATEFRMLHFLARRPGWVFTRYQIVDAVHGPDYPVTDRSVDVQIVGLRKKLGKAGEYLETIRGVGYRFKE